MTSEIVRARVAQELKQEFISLAASRGLTESGALQLLVQQFVAREKELQRRNAETMEALSDVYADLVFDGEEVLEWVGSWGADEEKEPPR